MTQRLSEMDKIALKLARERQREEARNARRDQAETDRARVRFERLPVT